MKKHLALPFIIFFAFRLSAQGTYLEYKTSSADAGVSGTSKVYSLNGNIRTETQMSLHSAGAIHATMLVLKDSLNRFFILDDEQKTYMGMDRNSPQLQKESDPAQYEITVVGKEKVNGFNATHIKVKRKDMPDLQDIWVSTEILNYKKYMSVRSKYASEGFMKALLAKGVDGFPVRLNMSEHGNQVQVDLVKYEQRSIDPSLFSLAAYHASQRPAAGGNAQTQEMMQRIQNMSPEERQKFIEEMRKQHSSEPH